MKRLLLVISVLLLCSSCGARDRNPATPNERYTYIIDMIKEHEVFAKDSDYFDIAVEMARIDGGYRYYITIDNPRIAMYDIEMLAIEKDVDHLVTMAANIGIFEETEYNMVPNQSYPEQGFVKGIVASAVSKEPETVLYVFVQFRNFDYSQTYSEYFELNASYKD